MIIYSDKSSFVFQIQGYLSSSQGISSTSKEVLYCQQLFIPKLGKKGYQLGGCNFKTAHATFKAHKQSKDFFLFKSVKYKD